MGVFLDLNVEHYLTCCVVLEVNNGSCETDRCGTRRKQEPEFGTERVGDKCGDLARVLCTGNVVAISKRGTDSGDLFDAPLATYLVASLCGYYSHRGCRSVHHRSLLPAGSYTGLARGPATCGVRGFW